MGEICAALNGYHIGVELFGKVCNTFRQVAVPGIVAKPQNVGRIIFYGFQYSPGIFEQGNVSLVPMNFFSIGGNETDVDRYGIRDQDSGVVSRITKEYFDGCQSFASCFDGVSILKGL